jgi:hypothetical protein
MRLDRGEAIDVLIMYAPALSDLIKRGKVRADRAVPKTRRMPKRAISPENLRTGCRNPPVVNDFRCRKEDLA